MKLPLAAFRLKNFKAVRDSGIVKFTPLTVFIGNNGSGKSSLIEGLQAYRDIVVSGLDAAMNRWLGFEYIHNPPIDLLRSPSEKRPQIKPIEFYLRGITMIPYRTNLKINMAPNGDTIFVEEESINLHGKHLLQRDKNGRVVRPNGEVLVDKGFLPNLSLLYPTIAVSNFGRAVNEISLIVSLTNSVGSWQFLTLNPYVMGDPRPRQRSGGSVTLDSDGSNIADYLHDLWQRYPDVFQSIIDTLQDVLPYATDLQTAQTSELQRSVYLQLTEQKFKVPGWLLSTGTLRVVAMLALLRHPVPPPLIVIEELENGLDPSTLSLIVREIARAVNNGTSQVIVTTHSPYLLDLMTIDHLVIVERDENGQPLFYRPANEVQLEGWKDHFKLGELYTMGRLRKSE